MTDEVFEKVFIEQYTYMVLAAYEAIIFDETENVNEIELLNEIAEKKSLIFVKKQDYDKRDYSSFTNARFVVLDRLANDDFLTLQFPVTHELAVGYIKFMAEDYPQIAINDKSVNEIIYLCGCSFHNINAVMHLCFFSQVTVEQVKNRKLLIESNVINITSDEMEALSNIGVFSAKGLSRALAIRFLGESLLEKALSEEWLFENEGYIITNVYMMLNQNCMYICNWKRLWSELEKYISSLHNDKTDSVIVSQVCEVLEAAGKMDEKVLEDSRTEIFIIESKLYFLYRFTQNDILLRIIRECKKLFSNLQREYIKLLVDEAVLYEDIEQYSVAKEKFEESKELCGKDINLLVFILDEYSRFLQKTGHYKDALKSLYFVEKKYESERNSKKLSNVRNRIGLNLCFIGKIKEAMHYLERLYWGKYNGEIKGEEVLSCEVANNLSICYMESGRYNEALDLQDKLYRVYLTVKNAPINYATDILQNKGSVYLYQERYKEARSCFEQALKDEENPYSRQLILENFMYAKAFAENNYDDSIVFFELQTNGENENFETYKMLAELYFAGGYYQKCIELCSQILKKVSLQNEMFITIMLEILKLKSQSKMKSLSGYKRIKSIWRLLILRTKVVKEAGKQSYYYIQIKDCLDVIFK